MVEFPTYQNLEVQQCHRKFCCKDKLRIPSLIIKGCWEILTEYQSLNLNKFLFLCYCKIIVVKPKLTVISLIYWDIGAQMVFIYWDVKSQMVFKNHLKIQHSIFKLSSELKSNENSQFSPLSFSFVCWVSLLLPGFFSSFRNCLIMFGVLSSPQSTWKLKDN